LKDGQHGFCYVRKNVNGKLKTLAYGKPYAVNVDPIEKKPLYHFLPGSRILSIGTAGCNLACKFCQNWDLSVSKFNESQAISLPPERVTQLAVHYKAKSIAFTYNEPTIFAEYAMDTAKLSHGMDLKNVMVTNGYITGEAIDKVYRDMDAANIDLKAFTDQFYEKYTLAQIAPVLNSIKKLKELNKWIELTTLVIPGYNDDEGEIIRMCNWIISEVGTDVPLHLSAFHPDYKFNSVPPTTPSTLIKLRKIALSQGLHFVYLGNIADHEGSNTYCPECTSLLIKRSWYNTEISGLINGHCKQCGYKVPGFFS
jgi:pyruvate formate lyase activating enzyme